MKYPIQRRNKPSFKERIERRRMTRPPRNPRVAVPSFFTLMNLFCGFLSIISVSNGDLLFGAWLIAIAGLFDVFDGLMARLANATSDFGIELDSISDMVSFGVAPGFLVYNFALEALNVLGIVISALPPLCGAVRLARFNVNARLHPADTHFIGLPIPAQALILGAFYLSFRDDIALFEGFKNGINTFLIPLIVTVSFLMVSAIPFDKVPRFDRQSMKKNKGTLTLFVVYLLLIVFFQETGLVAVFTIFILKGIIQGGIAFFNDDFEHTPERFENYS
ncbi:MAG: CDP-diacylglycerol--serine O-phosphatidyltransferase [Bacteroidota bacterium]